MRKLLFIAAGIALSGGGLACDRGTSDEVRQVRVPKEPPPAGSAAVEPAGREEIAWTVPATWKRLPGGEQQMRYATFQVSEEHPEVVVTVVPLGGESGSMVGNINRWEGQLGLPPTPEGELGKVSRTVESQAGPATLVDLKSTGETPLQLLAAVLKRGDVTWFYKLAGPAEVVGKEGANFEAFTKSTHFDHGHEGHAHGENAPMPATGTAANLPSGHPPVAPGQGLPAAGAGNVQAPAGVKYTVPAGWEQQGPRPMRDVTFTVSAEEKKGEVIVMHFPVGTGDLLSNVNRWREQVGLGPVNNVDPKTTGEVVEIAGQQGRVHDFVGPEGANRMRQMVATVNKSDVEWFIKIIGPAEVVESQKQAFLEFLGSVRLGD